MKLNELNIEYKQMEYQTERKEEVLCEGKYMEYQFYILSFGTHPTAYVEIPRKCILYYKKYDDIDIEVHGGLTYSESYLQNIKKNSWFIGWDYAHGWDYTGFDEIIREKRKKQKLNLENFPLGQRIWTTEEIFEDVVSVIEQIKEIDSK